ncbi:SusC/RagA family TonB-linked outer membrane protein [Aquimarina pacifica]|uniref:SusC/RagA family TonB-linked outer membrane protein n=1 Tax=Aquimarina pacifica TaxID=1296415 RepID=UPI0004B3349D|nr:TonB-dependent receptor [Aquimarina pacifica]
MYFKKIFTILMIVLCPFALLAQSSYQVEGVVTSAEDGLPIPGVNIIITGTQTGTSTDFDGQYQLKVKKGDILSFSYSGMKTVTVIVADQPTIDVQIEQETSELEQVVVIGYGTQRKSHLTGSISKLENKNLDELPYSDVSSGIKGKIAGVQIKNISGNVGDDPQILVRGIGSISLSSQPLIVVDGFPFEDGLQFINPSTIKSIEVLKDASSTAIYGSRGANGVIIVTTKEGKAKKVSYEFKSLSGYKKAFRKLDLLNSLEYADLDRSRDQITENINALAEDREASTVYYDNTQIAKRIITENIGGPTDWQDEALRKPARIDSYQLNVSGGTDKTNYYISGSYLYDEGLRKDNDLERINLSSKFRTKLSDKLTLKLNVNPSYTKVRRSAINFTDVGRYETWIPVRHNAYTAGLTGKEIGSFAHSPDFQNLGLNFDYVDPNSTTGEVQNTGLLNSLWGSGNFNPISRQASSERNRFDYRLITNISAQWKITNNLTFNSSLGNYTQYRKEEEFFGRDGDRDGINTGISADRLRVKYINENTLNFSKDFNGHEVSALVGITYENDKYTFSNIELTNFADENITTLNGGTTVNLDELETLKFSTILSSYLGRLNYSFKDRYLLSLVTRVDGFSRFGSNNYYGLFPSVSLGWNVANEDFWQNSVGSTVNRFKLRSSWGISGSNAIATEDYPAFTLIQANNYSLGSGSGTLVSGFGELNPDTTESEVQGNPDISWETNTEFNNGVDLGFFNSAVNLTVDYYYKISEKLLLQQAISNVTGFDEIFNNIGKIQNSGWEFDLSTNVGSGKFNWQASANIAFNENKLISFGGAERVISDGERDDQYITRVGDPYIQFYGYKTDGIFNNQEELLNSPTASDDAVGGLKRVDINGDGEITADDRTVIGNPFPDYIWGFTNTFTYGNLDLNFSFQGSQGADVVWGEAHYTETKRYLRDYTIDQYFNSTVNASQPGSNSEGVAWIGTDYAVQDASYISLREVILGYTLPKLSMEKIGLTKMRIYVSGQNLWYSVDDSYLGLNPEGITDQGNVLVTGYQRGVTPIQQQLAIGLDINF